MSSRRSPASGAYTRMIAHSSCLWQDLRIVYIHTLIHMLDIFAAELETRGKKSESKKDDVDDDDDDDDI